MSSDVQQFKCPQCGGKLEFDAKTQKMKCPFCDYSVDPEISEVGETKNGSENPNWDFSAKMLNDLEADELKSFVCTSCGGEIMTEKTTAATHCPYCGNPVVLSERISGSIRPDCIIPFKVTEQEAKEEFRKFIKSRRFAPSSFGKESRLEKIRGVYVPFWLFDSDVFVSGDFEGRKVRHWREGNYDCREVSYYSVYRSGEIKFQNVPIDASKKMPDDLMDSIEPFDVSKAQDFNTEYLSGFLADRYDMPSDVCSKRANECIRETAKASIISTVTGYDSVSTKSSVFNIIPERTKYALFPVWILNVSYHAQKYRFSMNGQTGKFVGNVPISKPKLSILFGSVAVGVTALLWGLGFLIGLY
ncbi:MAG: hypothetical protein IJU39_07300 [Clostridia bacterium]|nr:hypothetical protein [Clostridia bacterium]